MVVTTNYVIAELVALLISPLRVPRPAAIAFIEGLKTSPYVEIVHVDATLDEAVWQLLKSRPDKEWSTKGFRCRVNSAQTGHPLDNALNKIRCGLLKRQVGGMGDRGRVDGSGTSSRRTTHTTREAFLEACLPEARDFFQRVLNIVQERDYVIYWGEVGFSIRTYSPKRNKVASFVYGYPPS
jgi:hypothetical protein